MQLFKRGRPQSTSFFIRFSVESAPLDRTTSAEFCAADKWATVSVMDYVMGLRMTVGSLRGRARIGIGRWLGGCQTCAGPAVPRGHCHVVVTWMLTIFAFAWPSAARADAAGTPPSTLDQRALILTRT